MPETIHDSVLISIDKIDFLYNRRRRFGAYLVVVTCDTKGKIDVYESPLTYPVLHRPGQERPARIDFAFDGFPIYSSVGDVPDLVRFDVFMVRDRRALRRAGEVLVKLADSEAFKAAVNVAKLALTAATGGTGAIIAAVATAMAPIVKFIGETIEGAQDVVEEAYAGSKIFDAATLARPGLTESILSPTGNIRTEVDITLFDKRADTDEVEDLQTVIVKLDRDKTEESLRDREKRGARRPAALMLEL